MTIKALKLSHLEKLSMKLQHLERPISHNIDNVGADAVMPQLMHELLAKFRYLYEKDIFIPAYILGFLSSQTMTIPMLNSINQFLDDLAPMKKEDGLYTLKIEHCNIEMLSQDAVYQLLWKYIENQNLPKVLLCLEKLPKGNTDFDMTSLLQKAASFTNTNILTAIYENIPQSLHASCDPSPLFLAIHAGHLANVRYLLSIKQAQAQDFYSKTLNQHAFTNFPVDVMRDLFASGLIDIGNEIESMYENPLALAYGKEAILKMLLPHANHRSKLTALLRLITELHYANQCIDSMHDWIACLQRCICIVLNSLTAQEASCISTQKHRILQSQHIDIQNLFFEEIRVHHYNKAFAEKNQSLINHINLAFGEMRSTLCIETMTESNINNSNEFVIGICDALMNQLEVRKRAIQWRLNSGQWFQNDAKCREKIATIETVSQAWQRDHDIKSLSKLLHEKASILTQTTSTLPCFFQREVTTKEVLARYSPFAFLS